jgi:hypothetical protein
MRHRERMLRRAGRLFPVFVLAVLASSQPSFC